MADDRTPRTISLTEPPPEDDARPAPKRHDPERRRRAQREYDALVANQQKTSEQNAQERLGSKLV